MKVGGEGMGEIEVIRSRYVGMWWFLGGRLDVGEATILVDEVEN